MALVPDWKASNSTTTRGPVADHRAGLADNGGEFAEDRSSFSDEDSVRKRQTGLPRLNGSFHLAQSG
jgi:hypothetical protein